MELSTVRDRIKIEFENHIGSNEIDNSINEVIDTINRRMGGVVGIITVTGEPDTDWDELTIDWDSIGTDWADLGRIVNNFSWYATDYRLTIPENIILLKELYIDDEIWINQTYDRVKNTNYSSNHYYNHEQGSYNIYFPIDIASSDSTIKMKLEYEYTHIADGEIPLPSKFEQLLISGSIIALAGRTRNVISDFSLQRHINLYNESFNSLLRLKFALGGTSRRMNIW